jgi:hypothetical protein
MTTEVSRMSELPVRPRRRLITPWTLGLGAVIVAAVGFAGGVEVQKHHGGTAGESPAAASRTVPGFGGQAQDGAQPVTGDVASKDGDVLYVKTDDGTTLEVRPASGAKVTRNAKSSLKALHPGDRVVVQGKQGKNGTVRAAQITATANGVSSLAGFGGFGGFRGGGGGAAGANSQGSPSFPGQADGG